MNPLRLFFPNLQYTIETPLSVEDVLTAISGEIQPSRSLWDRMFARSTKPYVGTIEGTTFRIVRAIGYRNSFLPRITGNIQSTDPVSVKIRMGLDPLVIAFGALWLSFVASFLLVSIFAQIKDGKGFGMMVVGAGMLTFYVVMSNLAFGYEAKKSRTFLNELLRASRPGL